MINQALESEQTMRKNIVNQAPLLDGSHRPSFAFQAAVGLLYSEDRMSICSRLILIRRIARWRKRHPGKHYPLHRVHTLAPNVKIVKRKLTLEERRKARIAELLEKDIQREYRRLYYHLKHPDARYNYRVKSDLEIAAGMTGGVQ